MRIDVKSNGSIGLSDSLDKLSNITGGYSIIFDSDRVRLHTADKTWSSTVGDNTVEKIYTLVLSVLEELGA